jgi:RHS repeat-associated protein
MSTPLNLNGVPTLRTALGTAGRYDRIAALVALVLALLAGSAIADDGRISDAADIDANGKLTLSLPLILPLPRGGVPLPFAVTYNGSNVVGAAGMGWDIPIANVTWQHNLSRRKPIHRFEGEQKPATADRLVVDLGEGPMLMAPTNAANVYQPFAGGYYDLRYNGASFIGRDTSGRSWTFSKVAALLDDDYFALTSIVDTTGRNRVDFHYDVYDKFSPNPVQAPYLQSELYMRELVLREITHSPDITGACPKYLIQLDYTQWPASAYPNPYPLLRSLDFQAGRSRAHTRLLHSIKVQSNIATSCQSPLLPTDMTYLISYAADAVTGQPRLSKVDTYGANDLATDPHTSLPVSAYQYGSPLVSGAVQYAAAEQLTLPAGPAGVAGFAASFSTGAGALYGVIRGFMDFNGDGRADFYTLNAAAQAPVLSINQASSQGNDFSTFPTSTTLPNSPAAPYNLGAPDLAVGLPIAETIDNTYQQVIDFNGDGRPDILVATGGRNPTGEVDPNYWEVLINTPGPSGNASDIVWVPRMIDVTAVRAAIQSHHALSPIASTDQDSKPLPLARTIQVGAFANNVGVESGTLTQWKLIDVNGDGYPDIVFDDQDVTAYNDTTCDAQGHCETVLSQDHPPTTRLMVIYSTGPMMAGSGADSQSVWRGPAEVLRSDGACGVERLTWHGGGISELTCGFAEVNGDGIPDYVIHDAGGIRAILSSGLAETDDMALPDNQAPGGYPQQEAKRSIVLPGPVGIVHDPRLTVCGTDTTSNTTYRIEQQTALRDITGDGIADYIYYGTRDTVANGTKLAHPSLGRRAAPGPQRWWVMPGTGVGFAAPVPIRAPRMVPFAIYISQEQCNGQVSSSIAALQDIDGDGQPELVRAGPGQTVRIAKIVDSTGALGAHGAGQLTAIDNRYGGVTHLTYGSAKSNWITPGNNAAPEIVVTQTQQSADHGFGTGSAPIRYAYGKPETIYYPMLGRQVFSGYRRRVELIGEPTGSNTLIKGQARITESLAADEITSGDVDRIMLSGRVRDVTTLAGLLASDPRLMLSDGYGLRAVANTHTDWKTQPLPGVVPPLVSLDEECYATPSVQNPGIFGDLSLCRRTATAFVAEKTEWEGTHPYPEQDSVATRTVVNQVDDYARPTRITMEGDRWRTDDDRCLTIDYAAVAAGAPIFLDAPHIIRTNDCAKPSRTIAGVRYLYDNQPEGQVSKGFPTDEVLERYDVNGASLIEDVPTYSLRRDAFGNPVVFTRTRSDGATAATDITYDPFGIMPIRTATTATGLARPLISEVRRDAQTLLPLVVLNPNRAATYNTYDSFGRLTSVSLSLPGDSTHYIMRESHYENFDGGSFPRLVSHGTFSRWVPEAAASSVDPSLVSTYSERLDEFGRSMYGVVSLGSDYAGQSVVINAMKFDTLGRPAFAADPYPGNATGTPYGTTFTYKADGRLDCQIQGIGPQNSATTNETADRYPTCLSYLYANHQALTRTQGPDELAVGKPQSSAYDEEVLSATGMVLSRSRSQNNTQLERIEYAYDRLGQSAAISRWANPQLNTGRVSWQWSNDSLGNVLTATEPQGVSSQYTYDSWGDLSTEKWLDNTGAAPIQRGISYAYDGLSRLLSVTSMQDGQVLAQPDKEYFYDTPSGQPQHLDTQYLVGRLSWARTAKRNVYLGYDAFGRLTTISQSDAADTSFYARRSSIGPTGEIERQELLSPQNPVIPEQVQYGYDSARRNTSIRFKDDTGDHLLWRADQTDVFGRVLQATLGNGAKQQYAYRPGRRRELTGTRTQTAAGTRLVQYGKYDGESLLEKIAELSNFGGTPQHFTTSYAYDNRSALQRVSVQAASGMLFDSSYSYDGLGNLRGITDALGTGSLELRTDNSDPDRLCAVVAASAGVTPCNYRYDARGNVEQVHDTGALYGYDLSGRMTSGAVDSRHVNMDYGPFGAMASLRSNDGSIERRESFYGGASRYEFDDASGNPVNVGSGPDAIHSFIERSITSPQGTIAVVRSGDNGARAILYPIGESQGTRLVLNAQGNATQSISYAPFGSVTSDSGTPDSLTWWPYQWNGGHVLDGFGLVAIGARVLDGQADRFLQRDPRVNMATATTAHPYAFAWNNPIGFTDETGGNPSPDTGGVVSGLSALGKVITRPLETPGEHVDAYIELRFSCNADHDCISALADQYPLTEFEKELRNEVSSGNEPVSNKISDGVLPNKTFNLVRDRSTGAVLGYATFSDVVLIYDRSGHRVATFVREEALSASWLQPADIIAGPLTGLLGIGKSVVRAGAQVAEDALVTDLSADALATAEGYRSVPWEFAPLQGGCNGLCTPTGKIFINESLRGTPQFAKTLSHEGVHRWLTPTSGPLLEFRQGIKQTAYWNSHLLRYTEESLAEGIATRSPLKGLAFGFHPAYGINKLNLAVEAGLVGTVLSGYLMEGYLGGQYLSAQLDSP